jgi:hypothetical protein
VRSSQLRFGVCANTIADLVEQLHIRRGFERARAPDRLLIDVDHFVELIKSSSASCLPHVPALD